MCVILLWGVVELSFKLDLWSRLKPVTVDISPLEFINTYFDFPCIRSGLQMVNKQPVLHWGDIESLRRQVITIDEDDKQHYSPLQRLSRMLKYHFKGFSFVVPKSFKLEQLIEFPQERSDPGYMNFEDFIQNKHLTLSDYIRIEGQALYLLHHKLNITYPKS